MSNLLRVPQLRPVLVDWLVLRVHPAMLLLVLQTVLPVMLLARLLLVPLHLLLRPVLVDWLVLRVLKAFVAHLPVMLLLQTAPVHF